MCAREYYTLQACKKPDVGRAKLRIFSRLSTVLPAKAVRIYCAVPQEACQVMVSVVQLEILAKAPA